MNTNSRIQDLEARLAHLEQMLEVTFKPVEFAKSLNEAEHNEWLKQYKTMKKS